MSHRIERTALLPYAAEKLFELVNDVASYPQYMDGCVGAEILSNSDEVMDAKLFLKKGGLSFSFATRNVLQKPDCIRMELLEGPFDQLQGQWQFLVLASEACKVSLTLDFQLSHAAAGKAAEKMFETVAANLVNALCQRANQLYAK